MNDGVVLVWFGEKSVGFYCFHGSLYSALSISLLKSGGLGAVYLVYLVFCTCGLVHHLVFLSFRATAMYYIYTWSIYGS